VADAPFLLADIGGTNARFALSNGDGFTKYLKLPVEDFSAPEKAIEHYLATTGAAPRTAAIAVAGPVGGSRVALTNAPWVFDKASLKACFAFDRVIFENDFGVIAWGIPRLTANDRVQIGAGKAISGAAVAVLGPGTGLGVAGFLPSTAAPRILVTEGGHVTMAPANVEESELLGILRERHGHVSAERVLSGEGLENLYAAIVRMKGRAPEILDASVITQRAMEETCADCRQALGTFCAMLGTIAGNVALTMGARGGVYIAGGIVPRFAEFFSRSLFRERFLAKGRFRAYLEDVPTYLTTHPRPAFLGLMELCTTQQRQVRP